MAITQIQIMCVIDVMVKRRFLVINKKIVRIAEVKEDGLKNARHAEARVDGLRLLTKNQVAISAFLKCLVFFLVLQVCNTSILNVSDCSYSNF